jgi:hypothetical protein
MEGLFGVETVFLVRAARGLLVGLLCADGVGKGLC